ncbi:MAG: ribonuclease HI [Flavobacteriales bacterium]|jgi:ribonuclease HI
MASKIEVFTDGSSRGNPGPGGYGIVLKFGEKEKVISKGFRLTTNNRMELMAVIEALSLITSNQYPIHIYSDSKYVIESITQKWVWGWKQKGYKNKKNADLWEKYLELHPRFNLTFHWIKGHAGHPENERCDALAVEAALSNNVSIDSAYEASLQ